MPSGGGRRQRMQLIATEATRAPRRNAKYGRTARRAVSREDRCREVLQRPAHAHRMLPVDLLARNAIAANCSTVKRRVGPLKKVAINQRCTMPGSRLMRNPKLIGGLDVLLLKQVFYPTCRSVHLL